MKKTAILSLMLCGFLGMVAQDTTFELIDADGNVVPDGTTLTLTEVQTEEDPGTGETWMLMPAGLSVRNATGVQAALRMHVTIDRMDNGTYQICFPVSCQSYDAPGVYQTGADMMAAGETRLLNTEWLPDVEGICEVKLQVEVMTTMGFPPNVQYMHMADGPAVTLHFNNGIPEDKPTGDVNGDGKVDVEDVNSIINIILKTKSTTDYAGNADLNSDGKVDVEDVNVTINKILKL